MPCHTRNACMPRHTVHDRNRLRLSFSKSRHSFPEVGATPTSSISRSSVAGPSRTFPSTVKHEPCRGQSKIFRRRSRTVCRRGACRHRRPGRSGPQCGDGDGVQAATQHPTFAFVREVLPCPWVRRRQLARGPVFLSRGNRVFRLDPAKRFANENSTQRIFRVSALDTSRRSSILCRQLSRYGRHIDVSRSGHG